MRNQNVHARTTAATKASRGSRVVRRGVTERGKGRLRQPGSRLLVLATFYLLMCIGLATATVHLVYGRTDPPRVSTRQVMVVPHAKFLVLMVLDGARPDYFGLVPLPHVDSLRQAGTQYTNAMDGILETETPSGHTTIATGSTPAHNGVLGFNWAQNDNNYSLFSPDIVRSGEIERLMESAHAPTIAGLFKATYPRARVVALSGHKYYAADPLGGPRADVIMYYQGNDHGRYVPVAIPGHTPPAGILNDPGLIGPTTHMVDGQEDHLATKLAIASFKRLHQQITLINYPEFDWPLGHIDGANTNPRKVATLMRTFDNDLQILEDAYRKAGVLNQTLFVITADHGIAPISRFVPQRLITDAVTRAGTTAPAISYNTGTYIWLGDGTRAKTVAENILGTNDPGIQSVYYLTFDKGVPHYQAAGGIPLSQQVIAAHQYLLATLMNGHQPNVVAFCKAGQTTSDPTTKWKADHGGADWQSQHVPLIFTGPGIRPGIIVSQPAQLTDIAPTVLTAMGVKPRGMDGHTLTDAFRQPTPIEQRARKAEIGQINPVVDGLIAQENHERH